MFNTTKSKIIAGSAAALLAVAAAGVGAVSTLSTTLGGNHFVGTVPDPENPPTGGLLSITGDPLVHTFDGTKYNETVESTWTLTNKGDTDTPYDGIMQQLKGSNADLAKALTLNFGVKNGSSITWYDAGTLANPKSYDQALGLGSAAIGGEQSITIPVRVILPDPTVLPGEAGDQLTVDADFVVNYTDPNLAS